eukprot:scaffold2981_cov34-Prasinocladus_malaysianus.AAC.1
MGGCYPLRRRCCNGWLGFVAGDWVGGLVMVVSPFSGPPGDLLRALGGQPFLLPAGLRRGL